MVRTIATENKGIAELAQEIERFRQHFSARADRVARDVEVWKRRLLDLLEERLLDRVVRVAIGDDALNELAKRVAERKTDPYAAVGEILRLAGLGDAT